MKRTTLNLGTFSRFETCTLLIAFAWTPHAPSGEGLARVGKQP